MSAFTEAAEQFQEDFPECRMSTGVHPEHIIEGASYNTDEPYSYTNTQGVYVSLLCKRCGLEADYVPCSDGSWTMKEGK